MPYKVPVTGSGGYLRAVFGGIIVQPTTDTFGQTEVSDFDIVTYSLSPFLCGSYWTPVFLAIMYMQPGSIGNSKSLRFALDQRGMEVMLLLFAPWVNSSETHFINLLKRLHRIKHQLSQAVAKLERHPCIVFSSSTFSPPRLYLLSLG